MKQIDLKNLTIAIEEIAKEREVSLEAVFEAVEQALASAFKKEYGKKKEKYEAKLNPKTGELQFFQLKLVVDESMLAKENEKVEEEKDNEIPKKVRFNPERHILLEEAQKVQPDIKAGEFLKIQVESPENFGRIAAQTAKQVILQLIRELEKEELYKKFKEKEGEIISGIVQRVDPKFVLFDIGKISGILEKSEQIPNEFYRPGQRLKLFVLKVENTSKGPQVFLSRTYPKFVSKLFELEVPEIITGQVEIKSIAREPGSRTKIAVYTKEQGIDPIGAMIGQRGIRIIAVCNELGGEKIDVILWSEDPMIYIANALSPSKVLEVRILPKNKALAIVPDDQLSLAIGKDGQNVRLAAKLTGWKIDVRTLKQLEEEQKNISVKDKEEKTSEENQQEN
ncbi:MAG: transcription termination factor NusA [Minisyncoccia bacterium]